MGKKVLMKGNEAVAEAAILAGCRHYFAYPITPQSELIEYMAKKMPLVDGTFLQAESEVAAINMVLGAAACGVRVMTSSSSPGISLKQEGISYIAASRLPAVIVNVTRGGPGLGNIAPMQCDYFQATRGGGHGDYYTPVLSPSTVQEFADMAPLAFEIAEKYLTPVMILGDGMLGQMMEPVEFPDSYAPQKDPSEWALGARRTPDDRHIINSLYIDPYVLQEKTETLFEVYEEIKKNEIRFETYNMDADAKYLIVAHGTAARVAKSAVDALKEEGVELALIRPITLWPYPYDAVAEAAKGKEKVITIELSMGQMVEDVKLAVCGECPVEFIGKAGGVVFTPEEIVSLIREKIS
ncbi:3-methyl-2-oxobutanoate dehydrogenase subunit VorB [Desulfatibacillum aliphaticivorans]|uniref:3-methyl-2-oxobutanoate dehydrogenase subunit VorB n=1 Tax=Desulfatibacillum aliphaticivorans TaxID=218208 RepID=UPI0004294CE2|nr:3-methyl-2-oxobutanoate dehydrogenase subunit VorB [Desulfatibacillum aliphaticivorans]